MLSAWVPTRISVRMVRGRGMDFKVVAENNQDLQHAGVVRWWADGTAHLVVNGSDVTLCAKPAGRLKLVHGVPPDAEDVPWCEVCELTSRT